MPNDTYFAVMYKKLVDRNFEPDPQKLARTRRNLLGQLSDYSPSARANRLWTKNAKCDKLHLECETGEEKNAKHRKNNEP